MDSRGCFFSHQISLHLKNVASFFPGLNTPPILVLRLGMIVVTVGEVCKNGSKGEEKIQELTRYKLKEGEERKGD